MSFRQCFQLLVVVMIVMPVLASAQAAEPMCKDIYGNWVTFDHLANPGYDEAYPNDVVYYPGTDAFAFTVTYQDVINGSGFGFDDASQGALRRARVVEALTYIAGVLGGENGHADIHFTPSLNDGGLSMLASCGAYYWNSPNGFHGGFMYDHITTGVDPSVGNPDAQGTFNFGHNWYAGTGTPGGTQYDLLSVIIHEITHGLGYSSLIAYGTGLSEMSGTNPGVYSIYDSRLANGNGQAFCSSAGGAAFVLNPVTDMLGGNNGVRFTGPAAAAEYGSLPHIYAPATWESGSSISHWAFTVPSAAVMLPSYSAGQVKRTYLPFEIAALEDIGYDLGTTSDVPATGPIGIAILIGLVTFFMGFSRKNRK